MKVSCVFSISPGEWFHCFQVLLHRLHRLITTLKIIIHDKFKEHDKACDLCAEDDVNPNIINTKISFDEAEMWLSLFRMERLPLKMDFLMNILNIHS